MPEFIDQVFAKTSPLRSFSMFKNERFGLVFAKTGSINSGTDPTCHELAIIPPKMPRLIFLLDHAGCVLYLRAALRAALQAGCAVLGVVPPPVGASGKSSSFIAAESSYLSTKANDQLCPIFFPSFPYLLFEVCS